MQIDTSSYHTIQEASFDEETRALRVLIFCSLEQLQAPPDNGETVVEKELQDVLLSVPTALRQ